MVLYARRTQVNQLILLIVDVLLIFGVFRVIDYIQRGDWEFGGNYPMFFAIFGLLWWILAEQYPIGPTHYIFRKILELSAYASTACCAANGWVTGAAKALAAN
jgi:hypothetical protein